MGSHGRGVVLGGRKRVGGGLEIVGGAHAWGNGKGVGWSGGQVKVGGFVYIFRPPTPTILSIPFTPLPLIRCPPLNPIPTV